MLRHALLSGTLAAAATTAAASLLSRRATGSPAAALNATSHFLWGERAGRRDSYSLKYTAVGALANYGACIFWAVLYEALGRGKHRSMARALIEGAAVSATAYVTDYYLVPRRLTPGFEMRLPRRSLAGIYAALALGLAAVNLLSSE
jgi:hypothetical protein